MFEQLQLQQPLSQSPFFFFDPSESAEAAEEADLPRLNVLLLLLHIHIIIIIIISIISTEDRPKNESFSS